MSQTVTPETHIVIGDLQIKDGDPTAHLSWIGQYIADQFWGRPNVKIIFLGDGADMPSLSSYDKGKKSMEGRRYRKDVDSFNAGWALLNEPIVDKSKSRHRTWDVERDALLGNHENRINVAIENDAQLDGVISTDDLEYAEWGWKVVPFLEILKLGGVSYSHYFYHPRTSKAYGGENLLTRLKQIGTSFTMGHQQGLDVCSRYAGGQRQMGLVLGSSYLHSEKYAGPQGHDYWRGIVVCHNVEDGHYDRMEVSLEYLCQRYEHMSLNQFMKRPH